MLGSGVKKISRSEIKNIRAIRKSIVAIKPIRKGELFTHENLGVKRPGIGLSPMKWDALLGGKAKKDFADNELIML